MFFWLIQRVAEFANERAGVLAAHDIFTDTHSDPVAASILRAQDVGALKAQFAMIPGDWSRRYFYSLAMSRHFLDRKLAQWAAQEPDSADAHLCHGARLLKMAWAVRGHGVAAGVSRERWETFYQILDQTRAALLRAAELNPADPTPWALLICVAVFRSEGEREQEYFQEAIARDPGNWHAYMNRLLGLTKKWSGSHEAMFDFARGAHHPYPADSLFNCLVLKAHIEYWKYLRIFDEDEEAAEAHVTDPDVIAECLDVYHRALAHRDDHDHDTMFVRINAAATFWVLRQKEPLRQELERLGPRLHNIHWRWLGAEGQLEQAKRFASD